MHRAVALASISLLAAVRGQQVGTLTTETHPSLTWSTCVAGGTCTTKTTSVTLDSNWRWLHSTSGTTNCYTGNTWDATLCPNGVTCATNCALDGADYSGTYGITTSGNALTLKFVTNGPYSTNIGSRVYLMADDTHYQMFQLKNNEFTFDVDVSNLPCGLNGALYFSQMDADGGLSKYSGNKAGAKYGTGYCDAQCPHDIKFINGEANVDGWVPSDNDVNAGAGKYGTCCDEMDIWEANSQATAFTPHPCTTTGQTRCEGTACGGGANRYNGVCDADGCDFNSYRMGNTTFYGANSLINTASKLTVVTQFITTTGTASGDLKEIRRVYVQNGKVIQNSKVNIPGMAAYDSITDQFCVDQKAAFGDTNDYLTKGAMKAMGDSFTNGVVLVMSIWDDHAANMLWLDSSYPPTKPVTDPGVTRGPCSPSSGVPSEVEANYPNSSVTFSNIKFGPIGSTYASGTTTSSSSSRASSSTSSSRASSSTSSSRASSTSSSATASTTTVPHWGQCGGQTYTGSTVCASPWTCVYSNPWYSQCL